MITSTLRAGRLGTGRAKRWIDEPLEPDSVSRWTLLLAWTAPELWEYDGLRTALERTEREALASNTITAMPLIPFGHALHHVRGGGFADAASANAASHDLALLIHGVDDFQPVIDVELAVWRGPEPHARVAIDDVRRLAEPNDYGVATSIADLQLAVLTNATSNYAEALAAAQRGLDDNLPGLRSPQALPEEIEAAARSVQHDVGHHYLAQLDQQAASAGNQLALGILARCRGLMAEPDAETDHQEAIERIASATSGPDLARAHLAYGEWLRRAGRRAEARHQLHEAHTRFENMGATPYAERTRRELAATGARPRRQIAHNPTGLTPQEHQVARLAAGGETNSEIASRLYISSNTVDYHLRKVFQKLGLSSRREIAAALTTNS